MVTESENPPNYHLLAALSLSFADYLVVYICKRVVALVTTYMIS